jgi:hypothetical protein
MAVGPDRVVKKTFNGRVMQVLVIGIGKNELNAAKGIMCASLLDDHEFIPVGIGLVPVDGNCRHWDLFYQICLIIHLRGLLKYTRIR